MMTDVEISLSQDSSIKGKYCIIKSVDEKFGFVCLKYYHENVI